MTRYQLAKLISWTDHLRARKRLQKVVYLLQAAGCPFETEYTLLHYGPYSEQLARQTDEMVRHALLDEEAHENAMGKQYSYRLSAAAKKQIQDLEATEQGRQWAATLGAFESKAKELLAEDLQTVEYASTIVYFRRQGCNWGAAVDKAAAFKNTPAVRDALPLAKTVIA